MSTMNLSDDKHQHLQDHLPADHPNDLPMYLPIYYLDQIFMRSAIKHDKNSPLSNHNDSEILPPMCSVNSSDDSFTSRT